MTTYIITGATSMIGIKLCQYLSKDSTNIIYAITRRNTNELLELSKSSQITVLHADLSNIDIISNHITQADIFIHLAWAGTDHKGRNNINIQNDNIKYSLKAVDVAAQLRCKLFVEAGSQAEYGIVNETITADTPCNPINEYGKAKLKFGELASKKCIEYGIKFLHLRILSIFGETDHPWTLIMSSIKKMLNNEDLELSECKQLWNFVSIDDAVKQIYLLCEYALKTNNFKSEVYLIGSHDTRKLRSFIDEMYHLTKSKSRMHFGKYTPTEIVSLDPDMSKTEKATNGFLSDYTFGEVITNIINNYKQGIYDKNI